MKAAHELQTTALPNATVVDLAPARTVVADPRRVLVLAYDQISREARTLECATAELRTLVDEAVETEIVVFLPDHVVEPDLSPLMVRGCAGLATHTVMASLAPVTDAVKEISDGIVVGPVDRSTLAWVRGPAFVKRDMLQMALADAVTPTIRPLTAVARVVETFSIGRL